MIKNNKGFSLVEMLIVVAIMSVAIGFVTITLAVVNNANVNKAAHNYAAALNTCKVQCMSKGPARGQLVLTMENGCLYYTIGEDTQREMISSRQIQVFNGAAQFNDGDTATVSFNSAGMVIPSSTVGTLEFKNDNRTVATILYPETGKNQTALY